MKKIFALLSAVVLSMALMVGCGSSKSDDELVVYLSLIHIYVSVDYNILNRNGDKLTPTSISIKDNRTWEYTNLNVKDCIDEDGKISFSTENFYSGIHTVYLTYEDKVDNYTTNITFIAVSYTHLPNYKS